MILYADLGGKRFSQVDGHRGHLSVNISGRVLLNDCHGPFGASNWKGLSEARLARAGRLMGILGPSGAGAAKRS